MAWGAVFRFLPPEDASWHSVFLRLLQQGLPFYTLLPLAVPATVLGVLVPLEDHQEPLSICFCLLPLM